MFCKTTKVIYNIFMSDKFKISYRKANKNDLPLIQILNDKLFDYEVKENLYNPEDYIENWSFLGSTKDYFCSLIKDQFVYVAETANVVVGYIIGTIYPEDSLSNLKGKTAEIDNMFVEENYRNSGIGTKLQSLFIDWCKQNKVKRIIVTSEITNKKAIDFYKKRGFNDKSIVLLKKL